MILAIFVTILAFSGFCALLTGIGDMLVGRGEFFAPAFFGFVLCAVVLFAFWGVASLIIWVWSLA